MDVRGKTSVVTGASMGIGAAVARRLAAAGSRVVALARGRDKLEQLAAEVRAAGGEAVAQPCDLGRAEAIYETMDRVAREVGPVDILVNNVGAGTFKPLDAMTRAEVATALTTPFPAAVVACHAVVPAMKARGRGQIVNITSPAAYFPLPNMVPYTASRFAMRGLSLALREELAPHGIGVSLVCPSKVDTGYFERNDADFSWYPRISSAFPTLQPAQVAEEVLRAILDDRREHVFPWRLKAAVGMFERMPRVSLAAMKGLGLFRPARGDSGK